MTTKQFVYRKNKHKKGTRQGSGGGTKHGRTKGSIKPYRGQGNGRKSVKR